MNTTRRSRHRITIALTILALSALACSRDLPADQFEMFDGYRIEDRSHMVATEATRIHIQVWDAVRGAPDDDGSVMTVEFDIPGGRPVSLPFEYRFDDVPCEYVTSATRGTPVGQKARGMMVIMRAIPTGFVARYELTCDGVPLARTGVLEPVGPRRKGIWPYSPLRPGESWSEKIGQAVKDAWSGLTADLGL